METLDIWDQNCAAYMLTRGVELVSVIRDVPGAWASYRFKNDNGRASMVLREWSTGKATVNLQQFLGCYRHIKQLTFVAA